MPARPRRERINRLPTRQLPLPLRNLFLQPGQFQLLVPQITLNRRKPFLPLRKFALTFRKLRCHRFRPRCLHLFQLDPLHLDHRPLPLDRIPLHRQPLLLKLRLQLPLTLGRLRRLALQHTELARHIFG